LLVIGYWLLVVEYLEVFLIYHAKRCHENGTMKSDYSFLPLEEMNNRTSSQQAMPEKLQPGL
jgi:hypothetical protein